MKKESDIPMRSEYDFSLGTRGKHADRYRKAGDREELFRIAAAQDLQTWLGHALIQVQELEAALVTYLALAWGNSPEMAGRKAIGLVEKTGGKTWNRFLEDFQEQIWAAPDFTERLRRLVKERSWLVHRSGQQTESALDRPDETIAVIERLENLSEEATSLRQAVQAVLDQRLREAGLSAAEIEQKRESVLTRWRAA